MLSKTPVVTLSLIGLPEGSVTPVVTLILYAVLVFIQIADWFDFERFVVTTVTRTTVCHSNAGSCKIVS